MVVEESIHVIFYESNNSLQERESFDDDLGLETSMGKLQIEDRRQQEEVVEDPKKEESPLALPPPQQVQGESSQDLPKDWKFVINHPQDQIIGNPSSGALYGLKQAPRACEFEMSMMGELNFFLGLQIKQLKEGTFINQAKYIRDLLKRFNMEEAKTMKTPMSSSIKLDMDEKGKSVNSTMYRGMIGKRPAEPSQLEQTEAGRKARYDTALFNSVKDYQQYKQNSPRGKSSQGEVSISPNFSTSGLRTLQSMGWLPVVTIFEPIFPTLVRAFYSRATYGLGGPVLSIVRGVEIRLSLESICRILDIPSVGLRVCLGDGQTIGTQPDRAQSSHSSHDMLHLIATRRTLRRGQGQGQMHLRAEEEAEIREMEDGLDPQRDFEQRGPELDIPPPPQSEKLPSQTPHAPDHASWMDVSAQINSLGTRMEELALVHDTRFYSIESTWINIRLALLLDLSTSSRDLST
ncbi:hypothetical protein CK203_112730 [Vitis vinifera]|uniref:Reverse transcriptase Ty1/copia-type domain-containing protein n=1 Tax=Vitis vinifera TaxID=29760 RepID=A0A438FKA4_VITVI|nr:hypothetical protein CK203_112730 [Vitis vinifera]